MLDTSWDPHCSLQPGTDVTPWYLWVPLTLCVQLWCIPSPKSDLLPIHVPSQWGWLHEDSWAGVWDSCGGQCPGMLSIFVPGPEPSCWPQERAVPGSSAVQLSSSGYPSCHCPTGQHGPSLSSRIASWQQQWQGAQVAGLATCWALLTWQHCHRGDSWSWGSRHARHAALHRAHRQ